jgi:hypothetical protein
MAVASLVAVVTFVTARRRDGTVKRAHDVDWGMLVIDDAQLAGLAVDGTDLVIDIFGGRGAWQGHAADGALYESIVSGTPMLTLRSSFDDHDELARGLQRLERWWRAGSRLSLELVVTGTEVPQVPRRVVLDDGARSVSLVAPVLHRS